MKHYYAVAVYFPHELISLYDTFYSGPMRDYKFHRFNTRAERDKWVLDNKYDSFGRIVADKCTREIVEKRRGRNCLVFSDGRCFASF